MIVRSRCCPRSPRLLLFVVVLSMALLTATGCNRTKPRNHWWEIWKHRATPAEGVYHPDQRILPPPPDVIDPDLTGSSSGLLPAPPLLDEMALPEPDPVRESGMPVSELQMVYFAFDSSRLSEEAKRVLDANAAWLLERPGYEVTIEGHCDEQGTAEYNLSLGDRRAKAVRRYLIGKAVDGNRLHTISYGEERPAPGHTTADHDQNRRAQFLVHY